jgi:hypothetical protein
LKTIFFNDQERDGRIILREADGTDSGSGPMAEFSIISLSLSYKTVHSYTMPYTEVKFDTISETLVKTSY